MVTHAVGAWSGWRSFVAWWRRMSKAPPGAAEVNGGRQMGRVDLPTAGSRSDVTDLARSTARRRAAVLAVFNPSHPVENRTQLLGRAEELAQLRQAVLDLGAHALIYGARGAGKTSLARAFGDIADEAGNIVLYHACGGDCGFTALFRPYLEELDPAAIGRQSSIDTSAAGSRPADHFGPRELCAQLARLARGPIVLIVDEFDRVQSRVTRDEVATFAKLLSDARLPVRLLLVGIARDVTDLVAAHASLRRHLIAVGLRPFDPASVADLIQRGRRAAALEFPADIQARIATLAAGSPYHLRLFCCSAALAAIERGEQTVSAEALDQGLQAAYAIWSSTSGEVARLFGRVARDERRRADLVDLATTLLAGAALADGEVGPDHSQALPMDLFAEFTSVLRYDEQRRSYHFEDSLAAQFLLVACHLATSAPRKRQSQPTFEGEAA